MQSYSLVVRCRVKVFHIVINCSVCCKCIQFCSENFCFSFIHLVLFPDFISALVFVSCLISPSFQFLFVFFIITFLHAFPPSIQFLCSHFASPSHLPLLSLATPIYRLLYPFFHSFSALHLLSFNSSYDHPFLLSVSFPFSFPFYFVAAFPPPLHHVTPPRHLTSSFSSSSSHFHLPFSFTFLLPFLFPPSHASISDGGLRAGRETGLHALQIQEEKSR